MVSMVHQLLIDELIPGGAKKDLSAAKPRRRWPRSGPVMPRSRLVVGWAAELVTDLEPNYRRKKSADMELRELVAATGTSLLDLKGVGPSVAARLLVESATSPGSPTRTTSRLGTAPPLSTPPPATMSGTGSVPSREPTDQPGAPHHGHRPATQPHRGTRLLRSQEGKRQGLDGSHALPEATAFRPRLSADGQLTSHCRLFGQATSRTRHRSAYDPAPAAS
jgi:transposase